MGSTPTLGTNSRKNTMKLLVTGFGSFGKIEDNPSAHLAAKCSYPHAVLVVSNAHVDQCCESIRNENYDAFLHIGYADRTCITPETIAQNQIGTTPDTHGVLRHGRISETAPSVLQSTLWPLRLVELLNCPSQVQWSDNAGQYLCNYLLYKTLFHYPEKKSGFLHVPSFKTINEERQLQILNQIISMIIESEKQ